MKKQAVGVRRKLTPRGLAKSLSGDLFWVNDSAEDRGPLKLKASIAPSQSQWPTEHLH